MTAQLARHDRDPRLWTADQFLDFYLSRPEWERWQLVDGLAVMMTPPNYNHQRIVGNLEDLLRDSLKKNRPDLYAFGNAGLRIPGISDFNPQPDIIICAAQPDFEYYADQFSLVAEVLSPSNSVEMIDRKLELYCSHPDNIYCLTVDQDTVHVALYARGNGWSRTDLTSLDDVLRLPAFGFEARLSDFYAGTRLAR